MPVTDDRKKAIQKAAEEVAEVAIDSGSGCAYMVQRDAEKRPLFLLVFCDENAVDLQAMIDAVEKVTEGWFSPRGTGCPAGIDVTSRFLLWALKGQRVLLNRAEETPSTLLADFLRFEKARKAL